MAIFRDPKTGERIEVRLADYPELEPGDPATAYVRRMPGGEWHGYYRSPCPWGWEPADDEAREMAAREDSAAAEHAAYLAREPAERAAREAAYEARRAAEALNLWCDTD
jgi:hypothetical protein